MPRERLRKLNLFTVLTIVGFMIAQTAAGLCYDCRWVEVPDPGGGAPSFHHICLDGYDMGWYLCSDGTRPVPWCATHYWCRIGVVYSTEGPFEQAVSELCLNGVTSSDTETIAGEADWKGEAPKPKDPKSDAEKATP